MEYRLRIDNVISMLEAQVQEHLRALQQAHIRKMTCESGSVTEDLLPKVSNETNY